MKIFILLFCFLNSVYATTLYEMQDMFSGKSDGIQDSNQASNDIRYLYGKAQYEYALSTLYQYKNPGPRIPKYKRRVNLRDQMTPVKDQVKRGACCVFAVTALYEAFLKRFFPNEPHILSEQAYLSFFDEDGNNASRVANMIQKKGFIWDNPSLPYTGEKEDIIHYRSPETCKKAQCLPRKEYNTRDIEDRYPRALLFGCAPIMQSDLTVDLGWIFNYLSRMQMPVVAAIHVCSPDWDIGYITQFPSKKYIEKRNKGGLGNHQVLLTGYDFDKELLFFKNSWGTDWGDEGYGTITFKAFAAQHLGADKKGCHCNDYLSFIPNGSGCSQYWGGLD